MPQGNSWIKYDSKCPFSIANIPFGIISSKAEPAPRPAIAIGYYALDLRAFAAQGGFSALASIQNHLSVFSKATLNDFASLGRTVHSEVRNYLQSILSEATELPDILKNNNRLRETSLIPLEEIVNHLPFDIGDYTDFYAGRNHAYNVGVLFRGPANALQPNYNYLPVGYHGRASSVVVSGTPIRRPWGQILKDPAIKVPSLEKCQKLDVELELACFLCKSNRLGHPVPIKEAEEYIFGYALMNDWSARDIQAWEYVPLGPFTSKSLGTTISAWIVLADALEPFRTTGLPRDNEPMQYLRENKTENMHDISLEVDIISSEGHKVTISKTSSKHLLWSWPQMIAHHTITGCNLRPGDLFGSGTISGTEPASQGSLLELTDNGNKAILISPSEERKFLKDGDTVVIKGFAGEEGAYVGFGECVGRVEEALPLF